MRYKAIVFDFDGTLVNSKQVKIDAYYEAFSLDQKYDTIISQVLLGSPELNRYDTIQKIISCINEGISYGEVLERYNTIVEQRISEAAFLQYGYEILAFLYSSNVTLFLSSNTPLEILRKLAAYKKIDNFFSSISGYPHEKSANLREIITQHPYNTREYLVVGDGKSDESSARNNSVDFFAVTDLSLKPLADFLHIDIRTLK